MSRITAKHYAIALYDLLQAAKADECSQIVRAFLKQLYQAGQLRLLPPITKAFEQYYYDQLGALPVRVRTAQQLPTDTIQRELSRLFPQQKIDVTTTIDPAIVGGMLVETPNQRWNVSLAGQLETLAQSLKK